MNRKSLVAGTLMSLFVCAPTFAQEPVGSADLIFTGSGGAASTAGAEAAVLDRSKIDYLLLSERRDGSFDDFHCRVAAAFARRGTAGEKLAIDASADIATLKTAIDTAYEEFLAAARAIKDASGHDLLQAGTEGLNEALATLDAGKRAEVTQQVSRAASAAAKVVTLRATYCQRANRSAAQLSPAK